MPDQIDNTTYEAQLQSKVLVTQKEFSPYFDGEIAVFASPEKHYRMRAEFKAWHSEQGVEYAMYEPGTNNPVIIKDFPAGSTAIQRLMPALLILINNNEQLRRRLFQIEFLTSSNGDALISLIYHRLLDCNWRDHASELARDLNCHIIGRSKKQKIIINQDFITEEFEVQNTRYSYQQIEASFTQPNAAVCEHMLNWVCANIPKSHYDLLELYCGNGNFTLPLAKLFRRVLATEISKSSIQSALFNCAQNQIHNIDFVRLSSEELTQALQGTREFNRLKHVNLNSFQFDCVFVDPPRAGLDNETRQLISRFENIIYISCCPETLARDLQVLCLTHESVHFALFDQFPFSHHRECGVILRAKTSPKQLKFPPN